MATTNNNNQVVSGSIVLNTDNVICMVGEVLDDKRYNLYINENMHFIGTYREDEITIL